MRPQDAPKRVPPKGPTTHLVCMLAMACTTAPAPSSQPLSRLPPARYATPEEPFEPLPQSIDLDPALVDLGRRLFNDPLVSGGGDRTCAQCHDLRHGGVVPDQARSNHPYNSETAPAAWAGPYNVPTIFNVAFNASYNWEGAFDTLEQHLGGPMMSQSVMNAGGWAALIDRLMPTYRADFVDAGYPEGVTADALRDAFSAYQRSLITPDSRFDRYLRGELELSAQEARGYGLFRSLGCSSCHQGTNIGGNMYQRFGVMEDAFDGRETVGLDRGRYNLTQKEEDAFVFRVPSLRNVAATAPYFHDGSENALEGAVTKMARVQLGFTLDANEVDDLVAFLGSLTGEYDGVPVDQMATP